MYLVTVLLEKNSRAFDFSENDGIFPQLKTESISKVSDGMI